MASLGRKVRGIHVPAALDKVAEVIRDRAIIAKIPSTT